MPMSARAAGHGATALVGSIDDDISSGAGGKGPDRRHSSKARAERRGAVPSPYGRRLPRAGPSWRPVLTSCPASEGAPEERHLAAELQAVRAVPGQRRPARRIALLLSDLNGGGVQKMTLALAAGLQARGHEVDLVLYRVAGELLPRIPLGVAVHELRPEAFLQGRLGPLQADPLGFGHLLMPVLLTSRPSRGLVYLRSLASYLRERRPDALIAAVVHLNLEAVWAVRLAGVPTRVLVSERTAPSKMLAKDSWRARFLPPLMRRAYQQADVIVAVSRALGDDLAGVTGISRERIVTIYNPVVGPDLDRLAREPVAHPWFAAGQPPVILSAGRLSPQKYFPTLVRAFARLRRDRPARLVILGAATGSDGKTGQRTSELKALAETLGVADDLDLLGFTHNPYAFMARARLFALSSAYEGFGNVLVEAMACGCPVVSTDCPTGPAEILDQGRHGPLVPVGDDAALAQAMTRVLRASPDPDALRRRAAEFSVERSVDHYLGALFGRD
jgi:glycosyltransferase involved in cell wall biosynthesis